MIWVGRDWRMSLALALIQRARAAFDAFTARLPPARHPPSGWHGLPAQGRHAASGTCQQALLLTSHGQDAA